MGGGSVQREGELVELANLVWMQPTVKCPQAQHAKNKKNGLTIPETESHRAILHILK